jgi:preprotein translocase subunit SecA
VLVGTIAVSRSEALSDELRRNGIAHTVLNAKHHEQEAQIILDAGQKGAVTIATNMAGRGIDIKLPDEVKELGGLYVLGTERHESRRIDDQLRGRSGRQGDPGESRFFLSAQDDLVRVFAGDRMERVLSRFHKEPEDVPIFAGILSNQIKNAQKRVEERNFVSRKNVLKYDDVLNVQRMNIYTERRKVLEGADMHEDILDWLREEVVHAVAVHCPSPYPDDWELEELWKLCGTLWPVQADRGAIEGRPEAQVEDVEEALVADVERHYAKREAEIGPETMRQVERLVFLQVLDTRWREHLDNMDYLRDGIGLRGLAQKNPLNEYRSEGFEMFQDLMASVKAEVVQLLLRIEVDQGQLEPKAQRALDTGGSNARQPEVGEGMTAPPSVDGDGGEGGEGGAAGSGGSTTSTGGLTMRPSRSNSTLTYGTAAAPTALQEARAEAGIGEDGAAPVVQQRRVEEKVGRNDPCPCGSGKKYKNCHGRGA